MTITPGSIVNPARQPQGRRPRVDALMLCTMCSPRGVSVDKLCPACQSCIHICRGANGNPCSQEIVTKTGKVLTDADIQALADEAEAGYDVTHLLPRPSEGGPER